MSKHFMIFGSAIFAFILFSSLSMSSVSAETQFSETEISPMDATIALEKTTLTLNVPESNSFSWAYVEGKISNPVMEYPVIIQIFDDDGLLVNGNNMGAVHFAQTQIDDDGTYEYKFRIAGVVGGEFVNMYEGDYTVKIFKVVYLDSNLNAL